MITPARRGEQAFPCPAAIKSAVREKTSPGRLTGPACPPRNCQMRANGPAFPGRSSAAALPPATPVQASIGPQIPQPDPGRIREQHQDKRELRQHLDRLRVRRDPSTASGPCVSTSPAAANTIGAVTSNRSSRADNAPQPDTSAATAARSEALTVSPHRRNGGQHPPPRMPRSQGRAAPGAAAPCRLGQPRDSFSSTGAPSPSRHAAPGLLPGAGAGRNALAGQRRGAADDAPAAHGLVRLTPCMIPPVTREGGTVSPNASGGWVRGHHGAGGRPGTGLGNPSGDDRGPPAPRLIGRWFTAGPSRSAAAPQV
jgi:hypothetical protein